MRRTDITDEVAAGYVREIRDCLVAQRSSERSKAVLGPGFLEILPDGTLAYYSDAERNAFNGFISDPKSVYDSVNIPRQSRGL